MKELRYFIALTVIACFMASMACTASAEEGMWTLDNLPLKQLKNKYHFTPESEWLERVQKASVRFNDGGSGSFISRTGLVLTNHHVAVGQLQKMSSETKDYVKDGFYARTQAEEMKCPDLELNVLWAMQNVTLRIKKAVAGLSGDKALRARKAEIAKIEKENLDRTKLRSDVVTLYQGGEYWLYSYKKFRDVRLVIAPEKQIAFYGGNYDNFTYPRYDLDFAIFRVYEDDKPITPPYYFPVNEKGAGEGELVFVSGHPGTTKRFITYSQYLFNRDCLYPVSLELLKGVIETLKGYSKKGAEEQRRAATLKFSYENTVKAYEGEYKGLCDKDFTCQFEAREKKLRAAVQASPELRRETGNAWDTIAQAQKKISSRYREMTFKRLRGYKLPQIALSMVFFIQETKKPDGERLDGYHESQIDTWKYINLSPAPIYADLEEYILAFYLKKSQQKLGEQDSFVKKLLAGKTPEARAHELIAGTKMADPAFRKSLIDGGQKALDSTSDPLVKLALSLEPQVREMLKWSESVNDGEITPASEAIARARFKVYGKTTYPDATFTLRLAFGKVCGYPMNGTMAPPITTLYGLFDRYYSFKDREDWMLPARYLERKASLDLSTPMNFASQADITGGNSGSPVLNKAGELVGLIFDGNIESLAGRFIYSDKADRAVAVHSAAIMEALRKLYDAEKLVSELEGR
ncbi:MAG: S46 family peptidase [Candidatus Xenobiia bacterium LiM19]